MKEKNIKQLITDNIVIVVLILLVVGFSIGNPTFPEDSKCHQLVWTDVSECDSGNWSDLCNYSGWY